MLSLSDIEIGCPFEVHSDGTIDEAGQWADVPTVYHHPEHDIEIEGRQKWTALTGYTGQYSYNGAVMHNSEYMGGRLEDDVRATPGTYVMVEVLDLDAPDDMPEGWVVLRLDEGS